MRNIRSQDTIPFLLACCAAAFGQQGAVRCTVVEAGTGKPLEGAHAQLMAARTGNRPNVVYGAMTDRAGQFSVDPIRAGAYLITFEKPGYLAARWRGGMPMERLAVTAGERRDDCRFEMTRRAGISGRVVDANGDPVAGVPIRLYTEKGEPAEWPGRMFYKTDSRGLYRMSPAAGRYRIEADASDTDEPYGPTSYPGIVEAPPGGELTGIDIQLAPWRAGTISGIVTGVPAGEKAIVRVLISVNRGEMWGDEEVAGDGSFTLSRVRSGAKAR
ncbi:MAG TPA: carboxypeptidase-like regulatory domain-containing protein, partial [Rhodothermales bacterium]